MRYRTLLVCTAVFTAALLSASPSWAQGELRFGVWDNSTNPNNVMTYEPFEKDGSKLTVSNPSKPGVGLELRDAVRRRVPSRHRPAGLRDGRRDHQRRRASASTTSGTAWCTRW